MNPEHRTHRLPGGALYLTVLTALALSLAAVLVASVITPSHAETALLGAWSTLAALVAVRLRRWWLFLRADPHLRSLTAQFLLVTALLLTFWVILGHLWLMIPVLTQVGVAAVLGVAALIAEQPWIGDAADAPSSGGELGEQERLPQRVVDRHVLAVVDTQ